MDEAKRVAQQSFLDTLETLLLGLRSVFPECPHVKENLDDLQENIIPNSCGRHLVITKWHNDMKPYYGACERRNIEKILASDLDLVSELHMNEKWGDAGFSDESKEALWHFIDDLNKYARAYHPGDVVPIDINDGDQDEKTLDADIMAALEENDMFRLLPPAIARRLKEQAKTVTNSLIQGETTMENLDFSQLMGVASDLGNQCSAEDLQQMMTHLPQLMSSFNQTTQAASELGVPIPMANMMQTLAASGGAEDSNEVEQITGLFATMASSGGGGSNGGSMQQMMSIMKFAQHSEKHFEQKQE